ncbi:hypothetical protein MCOR27_007176 [Pyricularia oryzae]|uniref:SMP domain-containing protein n=5 Tax=Pyricularia TaxID=48558 RepID=A0ABQ8NPK6_PYRGI|nr:uncharacterized protein MGG_13529 [Pyricularia oryzae 70-15]ELQ39529.1 hypothetical protein OOU_Y34scaffold00495g8 [Pyricularia oryzae Y34]KAH8844238.1 hypothetical protein MCOR01_004999 [Pyricularia oryzae]KAI6300224.1 hypothetical protein MCOR33_004016 [Pyricularia grisea]EHA50027.1 hypothetical protein MGG_13529 [Pyricularia oryzae 70-15]KAH9431753.1 hypothetical protein MCOR02_009032 [Pyricularia oryzae]
MDKTAAKRIAHRGKDPGFAERARKAAARNAGNIRSPPDQPGQSSSSSQAPKKEEEKK